MDLLSKILNSQQFTEHTPIIWNNISDLKRVISQINDAEKKCKDASMDFQSLKDDLDFGQVENAIIKELNSIIQDIAKVSFNGPRVKLDAYHERVANLQKILYEIQSARDYMNIARKILVKNGCH